MLSMQHNLSHLQLVPHGILAIIGVGVALILFTYLTSTIQGARIAHRKPNGSQPPTLPYLIPVLGHLPEFLSNTKKFMARVTAQYGPSVPVQVRLLTRRMSILKGAPNVTALFRSSRKLESERWLVQVLINGFGVDPADTPFYLADDTGVGLQPDPRSTMSNPEHRIFFLVYRSAHGGLTGNSLDALLAGLVQNLSTNIVRASDIKDEWTEVPDIYAPYIRSMAWRASVRSLFGSHILKFIPTIEEDFWLFDSHLPPLFKETPRWLAPESYRARDKLRDNFITWEASAAKKYTEQGLPHDEREWEEYFGSKMMRTRHEFFKKTPLSKESVSAENLGLMWASTANIVPATAWMLLEILQRPKLLEEIRRIIHPYVSWHPSDPMQTKVDIPGLCSLPLLQSIYAEVLRVHTGSVISRIPNCDDFNLGGWNFTKDQPIIVSAYHVGRDETIWNQGTAEDPHPVDDFWPERFIVYPDDPHTGPVLKSKRQGNDEKKDLARRFSLDGTAGSWVPYGGGTRMCPGRHFAKAEMIVATALFLTAFDIELLTDKDSWIRPDLKYFMFGVMHPEGKIPARIRRRKSSQ